MDIPGSRKITGGCELLREGEVGQNLSLFLHFFPDDTNPTKIKDKWRNLIKYNSVKCCKGKFVLN